MIKSKKTESIGGIIECILHAWMLKEYYYRKYGSHLPSKVESRN